MLDRRRFLYGTALTLSGACRPRRVVRTTGPSAADSGLCVSTASAMPRRPEAPRLRPPLQPNALARFVDLLPIPPTVKPAGLRPDPQAPGRQIPYYRVTMRETMAAVHRDVPPTRVWSYGGSFPGPTFETRSGQGLLVEWANELPEGHFLPIDHTLCGAGRDRHEVRTVVHVHGARVPPDSDGHPESWITPGGSSLFHYPNRQEAATLWYHDHAMGLERLNQYAGLFGLFLIRDEVDDALGLPHGAYEMPLFLSDRLFDVDGQLVYPTSDDPQSPWIPELRGDAILVNGKLFPYFDVEPRLYRFRMVNASNARFYYLSLSSGQSIHQIGSDQGLLPAPVPLPIVTLGPGERADVLVDFGQSPKQEVVLLSQLSQLVQFRVAARRGPSRSGSPLPSALRPVVRTPSAAAVKTRFLTLDEYETPRTLAATMLLNGSWWHDPVTETPALGSVEIWELVNLTEDSHPIHLHMVRFQILERQPFDTDTYNTNKTLRFMGPPVAPAPQDAGWKDTVRADPGFITRIIVRFEGYPGHYVWHCHILEHAAKEMMRPFEIVG